MIRSPCRFLAVAVLLLAAAGPAVAESAGEPAQQLSTVEQQLQSSQDAQARMAAELAAALKEQDEVSARLVAVSRAIQGEEVKISASEDEMNRLRAEQVTIEARLADKQDVLSELLAGLQRLEQNPPPALVVEPDDVLSALRGAMMFGAIVPELRDEADALAADLSRLDHLASSIKLRRNDIHGEMDRLNQTRQDLMALIDRKKELVARNNADLASERQRAAVLAATAKSLKQLMGDLQKAEAATEAERQAKIAAEEEAKRLREAALQRPSIKFADARGRLDYPAQGHILKRFGDDDGLGGSIQGTVIATRAEAQVTAPADGKVEFAGPFRSYGQLLILNPGGGYHILMAGMANITASTGEFLRAGEPVGQMGNGPSSVTLLGDVIRDSRPVLYIEFRNNTDAIDSGPWWIGGLKEARG
jgi:septal ring factor EnvC (AmiA/AmiB activator)